MVRYAAGFIALFVGIASAHAGIRPDKVFNAEPRKTQSYVRDGLIIGGDSGVENVVVKDIRRASNSGFERIVIDLEGTQNGETVELNKPPYYQVAVSPGEKRLVFTLFGSPRLGFDAKKVSAVLNKSKQTSGVELFPLMDEHSWTFAMGIDSKREVEVFELTNPVRIILDVRTSKTTSKGARR